MVGIKLRSVLALLLAAGLTSSLAGCVTTEALYAQYDAADCLLVANTDANGTVSLHEQNTDTHYPWEPAVYFAFNSSVLDASETARLDKSMQVLKQFPSLVLGLQGFTDRRGTKGYNLALAQRRVDAVQKYMESKGVTANRILLQPIGEVLPQISTDDTNARAVNRRVELMLLDSDGRPTPIQYASN